MLKLQVALGDETEVIRADVFEGANPSVFFAEATDDLVFLDAHVPLFDRIEVADNLVHLEVSNLLELLEVGLSDLDRICQRLRQGKNILALFTTGSIRCHGLVELVGILQDSIGIDAKVVRIAGFHCRTTLQSRLTNRGGVFGIKVRDHVLHTVF